MMFQLVAKHLPVLPPTEYTYSDVFESKYPLILWTDMNAVTKCFDI